MRCNREVPFPYFVVKGAERAKEDGQVDDVEIIDLYWERSENAIRETDVKYGKLILHLAGNILRSREDAEECVNDTYLGAWNAMPPERPRVLCAFITRITRNLALKKIEYATAQKRNPEVEVSLSELDDCISGTENVGQQYEAAVLAAQISDFLRAQDDESRNVFIRRYWFYDSVRDIADLFSMSESKVKSMLFRTRNKLKNHLIKEGYAI